jgi:hypothetical protein
MIAAVLATASARGLAVPAPPRRPTLLERLLAGARNRRRIRRAGLAVLAASIEVPR